MVFEQAYCDENKGVRKGLYLFNSLRFLLTLGSQNTGSQVLPSRQQNGGKKKKHTSLGNLISSKWGRNASRGSSMKQPDCLAVNPMVDKSPSSPSLSPTHNIQAAFKMLDS